nr:immunoglobulin heavy chain junction region [Macaca mulatta]MOW45727.1 immunoglobulin heavy chain junction region [Macaca mulatta]MOW45932.1 immunoglobulin heavy chain junction region [Macaca mulatta]MOW46029.1 immunoglobulin heavy chain junction region [Macaca mulatta]MOW46359.1 immunoglobulin heavy chain junction region [Macaca mulatta]
CASEAGGCSGVYCYYRSYALDSW